MALVAAGKKGGGGMIKGRVKQAKTWLEQHVPSLGELKDSLLGSSSTRIFYAMMVLGFLAAGCTFKSPSFSKSGSSTENRPIQEEGVVPDVYAGDFSIGPESMGEGQDHVGDPFGPVKVQEVVVRGADQQGTEQDAQAMAQSDQPVPAPVETGQEVAQGQEPIEQEQSAGLAGFLEEARNQGIEKALQTAAEWANRFIEGAKIELVEEDRPVIFVISLADKKSQELTGSYEIYGGGDRVSRVGLGDFNIVISYDGKRVDISAIPRDQKIRVKTPYGEKAIPINHLFEPLPEYNGAAPWGEIAKYAAGKYGTAEKQKPDVYVLQIPMVEIKKMTEMALKLVFPYETQTTYDQKLGKEVEETIFTTGGKYIVLIRDEKGNLDVQIVDKNRFAEITEGLTKKDETGKLYYNEVTDYLGQLYPNVGPSVYVLLSPDDHFTAEDVFQIFRRVLRKGTRVVEGEDGKKYEVPATRLYAIIEGQTTEVWWDLGAADTRSKVGEGFVKALLGEIKGAGPDVILRLLDVLRGAVREPIYVNATAFDCEAGTGACLVDEEPDRLKIPIGMLRIGLGLQK